MWLSLMGIGAGSCLAFVVVTAIFVDFADMKRHHARWVPVYSFAGFIVPVVTLYTIFTVLMIIPVGIYRHLHMIRAQSYECNRYCRYGSFKAPATEPRLYALAELDLEDCVTR